MISSRSLRQIPSNIHHANIFTVSSRESDVHNLRLLHDVDQCNVLLTYTLVSPHSICALNDHVLHISRHLTNRNPDVFSTRHSLFLITFEYFRVSSHLLISVWVFIQFKGVDIHYRRNNGKDALHKTVATVHCTDGIDLTHFEDSTPSRIVNDGFSVRYIIIL